MSLVEDAVVPGDSREEVNVIPNNVVGGDDEVVLAELGLELVPLRGGSVVVEGVQVLLPNELINLVDPVASQRWRTDHDRRPVLQNVNKYV